MIYRKDGDRKVATAEMTRLHTVNFNNNNCNYFKLKRVKRYC